MSHPFEKLHYKQNGKNVWTSLITSYEQIPFDVISGAFSFANGVVAFHPFLSKGVIQLRSYPLSPTTISTFLLPIFNGDIGIAVCVL
jgi:hypothetical protein